jgi:hypothetical protein
VSKFFATGGDWHDGLHITTIIFVRQLRLTVCFRGPGDSAMGR